VLRYAISIENARRWMAGKVTTIIQDIWGLGQDAGGLGVSQSRGSGFPAPAGKHQIVVKRLYKHLTNNR
jgi:hypothetical protein